jgi:hypothetical protein
MTYSIKGRSKEVVLTWVDILCCFYWPLEKAKRKLNINAILPSIIQRSDAVG